MSDNFKVMGEHELCLLMVIRELALLAEEIGKRQKL